MSAEDLPYQLRPNKFIDRRIFVDLLSRIVPFVGASHYVYISMGGKYLVDHAAVYRYVGIDKLFSFDKNDNVISRQKVNCPINSTICEPLSSGMLAGRLEGILSRFEGARNLIVWLDYTNPHERLTQLQELMAVAGKLESGDILRITMNANLGTLDGEGGASAWKLAGFSSPQEYRIDRLREQIEAFVPDDIKSIEEDTFPSILCQCIRMAFSKVERSRPLVKFIPILNTSYRDGQRMVTVTCISEDIGEMKPVSSHLAECWGLAPAEWGDVVNIAAPDLSAREKVKLDGFISESVESIAPKLGFKIGDNEDRSRQAIESYKMLHRYYPSFQNVDR